MQSDERKMQIETQQIYNNQCVDYFAGAMKAKLHHKVKDGWGGWDVIPTMVLARGLRDCVLKGDPVDVANYAMMLWHRGAKTDEDILSDTARREAERREPKEHDQQKTALTSNMVCLLVHGRHTYVRPSSITRISEAFENHRAEGIHSYVRIEGGARLECSYTPEQVIELIKRAES